MPPPLRALLVALVSVAVVSCSSGDGASTTTVPVSVPGPDDPAAAVTELFSALASEDFQRAAELTVDDQMVAIAVAEDSTLAALQMVVEDGGNQVAANYWSGFAANLEELLGVGPADVGVGRVTTMEIEGEEFARVELDLPVDQAARRFVLKRVDGWKVDVVATFAPTLATRLARTADSLQADPGAAEVIATLSRQRTSLEAALRSGSIDGDTSAAIQTAIEALTP